MDISEQEIIDVTKRFMTDETPLPLTIQVREAWILISGLQLATRHPAISPQMKQTLESIGRQFQSAITGQHPAADRLLEMGWRAEFDEPRDRVVTLTRPTAHD